ncbi:hypothetical protein HY500_02695 [Candidatus Woesearchaeota archaeon]|nr:hypothetical protein [Candidatus Woesearchaeota archaeon]
MAYNVIKFRNFERLKNKLVNSFRTNNIEVVSFPEIREKNIPVFLQIILKRGKQDYEFQANVFPNTLEINLIPLHCKDDTGDLLEKILEAMPRG